MRHLNALCNEFGFADFGDFMQSLIHTKLVLFTLPLAAILATLELYMGLSSVSLFALVVLLAAELATGLAAAKLNGVTIESRKFSRFGLKLLAWGCLIFVFQSLYLDIIEKKPLQAAPYGWAHSLIVLFIAFEYSISILENIGKIEGGKFGALASALRAKMADFMNLKTEGDKDGEVPLDN